MRRPRTPRAQFFTLSPWLYLTVIIYLAPLLAFWTLDPGFYGWYMRWGRETGIFVRHALTMKDVNTGWLKDHVMLKIELALTDTVSLDPGRHLGIGDLCFKLEGKKLSREQFSARLNEIYDFARSEDTTSVMRVKDFKGKTRLLKPPELCCCGTVLAIPRSITALLAYQELVSICDMLKQENAGPIVILETG